MGTSKSYLVERDSSPFEALFCLSILTTQLLVNSLFIHLLPSDDDKTSKGTKNYDNRYGLDRKLYAQDDYHFKDDEEEGPVEIASVTVHFLIGGGEGTDTDGDGICDSQDIWGNCPDPEEECKYGYLEIDGCETMACKDACLISDWVYNCEKYEHDCDDYLTCVETGANALRSVLAMQTFARRVEIPRARLQREENIMATRRTMTRTKGQIGVADASQIKPDGSMNRQSLNLIRLQANPHLLSIRLKMVTGGQRDAEVSTDIRVRPPGFDHKLFFYGTISTIDLGNGGSKLQIYGIQC